MRYLGSCKVRWYMSAGTVRFKGDEESSGSEIPELWTATYSAIQLV